MGRQEASSPPGGAWRDTRASIFVSETIGSVSSAIRGAKESVSSALGSTSAAPERNAADDPLSKRGLKFPRVRGIFKKGDESTTHGRDKRSNKKTSKARAVVPGSSSAYAADPLGWVQATAAKLPGKAVGASRRSSACLGNALGREVPEHTAAALAMLLLVLMFAIGLSHRRRNAMGAEAKSSGENAEENAAKAPDSRDAAVDVPAAGTQDTDEVSDVNDGDDTFEEPEHGSIDGADGEEADERNSATDESIPAQRKTLNHEVLPPPVETSPTAISPGGGGGRTFAEDPAANVGVLSDAPAADTEVASTEPDEAIKTTDSVAPGRPVLEAEGENASLSTSSATTAVDEVISTSGSVDLDILDEKVRSRKDSPETILDGNKSGLPLEHVDAPLDQPSQGPIEEGRGIDDQKAAIGDSSVVEADRPAVSSSTAADEADNAGAIDVTATENPDDIAQPLALSLDTQASGVGDRKRRLSLASLRKPVRTKKIKEQTAPAEAAAAATAAAAAIAAAHPSVAEIASPGRLPLVATTCTALTDEERDDDESDIIETDDKPIPDSSNSVTVTDDQADEETTTAPDVQAVSPIPGAALAFPAVNADASARVIEPVRAEDVGETLTPSVSETDGKGDDAERVQGSVGADMNGTTTDPQADTTRDDTVGVDDEQATTPDEAPVSHQLTDDEPASVRMEPTLLGPASPDSSSGNIVACTISSEVSGEAHEGGSRHEPETQGASHATPMVDGSAVDYDALEEQAEHEPTRTTIANSTSGSQESSGSPQGNTSMSEIAFSQERPRYASPCVGADIPAENAPQESLLETEAAEVAMTGVDAAAPSFEAQEPMDPLAAEAEAGKAVTEDPLKGESALHTTGDPKEGGAAVLMDEATRDQAEPRISAVAPLPVLCVPPLDDDAGLTPDSRESAERDSFDISLPKEECKAKAPLQKHGSSSSFFRRRREKSGDDGTEHSSNPEATKNTRRKLMSFKRLRRKSADR